MRIVLLSFYSGRVDRGVEVYAQELKQRLNFEVDIIAADHIYPTSPTAQIRRFTQKALSNLEADPPDILYPLNNRWQSILCKMFCLRHGTKLVLGGHSGLGWDDKLNLWLFPDVFICFTRAQATWAKKINPFVRVAVISHGVDIKKFSPVGVKAKLSFKKPIFLTTATETKKNIDATKKAVSELENGSLISLGTKDLKVPHYKIDQYYRAADVFVLTSSPAEAFGISYLEALACNLPVVATDDPIRQEIIGKAGIFIKDPNNIDEYKMRLEQAISKNWDNLPRQQSLKYSWDKIILKYEKLFNSLKS